MSPHSSPSPSSHVSSSHPKPSPSYLLNPSSPSQGLLTDSLPFLPSAPDQPPSSFYMVRIISKAPCMVLRLGFPIGTPAQARHKVSWAPTHSQTKEPWNFY